MKACQGSLRLNSWRWVTCRCMQCERDTSVAISAGYVYKIASSESSCDTHSYHVTKACVRPAAKSVGLPVGRTLLRVFERLAPVRHVAAISWSLDRAVEGRTCTKSWTKRIDVEDPEITGVK